jgi:hypothetical protein
VPRQATSVTATKFSRKTKVQSYSNGIRTFTAPASLLTVTSLGEELPDARSNQESR